MNRALLAEWRGRARPGGTIIRLANIAHADVAPTSAPPRGGVQ